MDRWGDFGFVTYLKLVPNINSTEIAKRISTVFNTNTPQPGNIGFSLQRLKDIHFSSGLQYDTAVLGDIKNVYIFSLAAFFILFIASMNFINLSTARSAIRFKEIGVRKSIGAKRSQLIIQFFTESIAVIVISVMISIVFVEAALPAFNQLSGKYLTFNIFDLRIIFGIAVIVVLTALMAETYPALYLSRLNPVNGIKANPSSGNKGQILRTILIVTQFSMSIGLIIATIIIYEQIAFMKEATPGFNDEGVIYIPARENMVKNNIPFKHALIQYPEIISAAYKDYLPTNDGPAIISTRQKESSGLDWEGRDKTEIKLEFNSVDIDYFKTIGMKIVKGRNFSRDIKSDENEGYILNEEAVKQMQLRNPIGKWVKMNSLKGKIIGIVGNAHFKSLRYKMQPQIFMLLNDKEYSDKNNTGVILIKIKGRNINKALADIKTQWVKINTGTPFEFHFLNEAKDNLYRAELKIKTIFNYFTLFAIFISCLGLFGLSSFIIEQKRKEIGIRKVLGASIFGIVTMLTKNYTKWIIAANIIAWPLSYYAMYKWLQNYAYHININLWIFAAAGAIAVLVSLLSVSFQAIKAAAANPVKSLKYE